jgi:exodeoxyribonuclease-5
MNNLVRRIIFGEEMCSNKILVGEKLIANSPIIIHDNIILFNTNDEFSVEKIEVKEKNFNLKEFTPPMVAKIKYYEATVNYINDQDEVERCDIEIIHEDSEVEFQKISLLLKNRAIANGGKDRSWLSYYKFIRIFADVSFGYSITAHKAQGSTYDTTFVLEDDIDMNLNIVERNRIKYTSYTRSSRKVYVLKRF